MGRIVVSTVTNWQELKETWFDTYKPVNWNMEVSPENSRRERFRIPIKASPKHMPEATWAIRMRVPQNLDTTEYTDKIPCGDQFKKSKSWIMSAFPDFSENPSDSTPPVRAIVLNDDDVNGFGMRTRARKGTDQSGNEVLGGDLCPCASATECFAEKMGTRLFE